MSELEICRVCLNTNVKGFSFDFSNLREDYEEVTGLKSKDAIPQWACYECATLLHKFHKFKEKCRRGQKVLEKLESMVGPISYKTVERIDRMQEHLLTSLSLFVKDKHSKTYTFKHPCNLLKEKKALPTVKEVIYYDSDVESTTKPDHKEEVTLNKEDIKVQDQKAEVENIKIELTYETQEDNTMDIDNISMGNPSDDENIFLDIVKKAVNGENQLVFLDGVKDDVVDNKKSAPKKFMKKKKEYLNMEYWKKYRLTEEEASVEFKSRENSDKYIKANYKCQNCLKGFSKLEMLMRHLKSKHDESIGPIECRFCHMRFKQKCMLTKHMVQHYTVYHCLRCDMRFYLDTSAIFHEDYHNGVIRKCKHCGEEFKHCSTFYTHMRMAHRSRHICSLCGVSFVSEAGLAQHVRIKHFDNEHTEASSETEKNIYCEKCDVKFISQEAYDLHLSHSDMHADGIPDREVKRRNFKGRPGMGSRKTSPKKAKKPTTCIHCGKYFQTQAACMKHHIAEHPRKTFYSSDQRHICEVCGASLAAVSIASHMNRHTREHVYPCDTCGMQFISKSSHLRHQVVSHMNRHTREHVYPCDTCGMQFISKSSHLRHQVTHTGERPYPCPLCDKRFTQKNSMKLHYRTFHLKQPYPKRNRKRKTDEMPLMESCREREESHAQAARWRIT